MVKRAGAIGGPIVSGAVFALILAALVAVMSKANWPISFGVSDWAVVRFTIWQAILSASLSVVFAIPVARALARRQFQGRSALVTLFVHHLFYRLL